MIVVDSSVWIPHFNEFETEEVRRLRSIPNAVDIIVGDIVLLEVLRGARSHKTARYMEQELRLFTVAQMLGADIAIAAARNYRELRALGITIRSSIDMIIGTFCIAHGHLLLHRDRDFQAMEAHLGLKVFRPH